MSVINQVLNQLEQRGTPTTAEQTMVRAVSPTRRKSHLPWLVLLLVLSLGLVVWQTVRQRQTQATASKPIPTSAVLHAANNPVDPLTPASRLSFEMNSVPPPSALRQGSGHVSREAKDPAMAGTAASVQPARNPDKHLPAEKVQANIQAASGVLPIKHISPAQQADAEFRKAAALMQQGRVADAITGYEAALHLDAGHDAARQALVALLLEGKRVADAERILQEGLQNNPEHTGFAMLLARFQVERDALDQAVVTLERSLPYAEKQADYQAFFAALLQRQSRHKEAAAHYQVALQLAPNKGIWLMGYGISLQAMQRNDDARESFNRALDSKTLSPELQAFVQKKLKGL